MAAPGPGRVRQPTELEAGTGPSGQSPPDGPPQLRGYEDTDHGLRRGQKAGEIDGVLGAEPGKRLPVVGARRARSGDRSSHTLSISVSTATCRPASTASAASTAHRCGGPTSTTRPDATTTTTTGPNNRKSTSPPPTPRPGRPRRGRTRRHRRPVVLAEGPRGEDEDGAGLVGDAQPVLDDRVGGL